jgi:DNA-directed RNA polymerase subunit alpha
VGQFQIECVESKTLKNHSQYGKFVLKPLERGQGTTVGNSLRRVLLSNLEGAAITAVRIAGINHEFASIDGVREDVMEILLNMKEVVLKSYTSQPQIGRVMITGPATVRAAQFDLPSEVEIVDPSQYIATLAEGARLEMEFQIEKGKGYRSVERGRDDATSVDFLQIDAVFMPVSKVNYSVEDARFDGSLEKERLLLDIWTNGSLSPHEAMSQAANILVDLFNPLKNINVELIKDEYSDDEDPISQIPVEELQLSVRAYNCLKRAQINSVADLLDYSQQDLLEIKNFDQKSAGEVIEALDRRLGITLPIDKSQSSHQTKAAAPRTTSDDSVSPQIPNGRVEPSIPQQYQSTEGREQEEQQLSNRVDPETKESRDQGRERVSKSTQINRIDISSPHLPNIEVLERDNPQLTTLRREANSEAWNQLINWVNEEILSLDLDAAAASARRLKERNFGKPVQDIARILIVHKSLQTAGVDVVRAIPYAEDILSGLLRIDLPAIAKMSAEMVYQIAAIYGFNLYAPEREAEVLTAFGIALIGEKAIDDGIRWLKYGITASAAISASVKALMIYAIGNAACIFYEAKNRELSELRARSQAYLEGKNSKEAVIELIDSEIQTAFTISYNQLRQYLVAGQWKKADIETGNIILQLTSPNEEEIKLTSISNLPTEDVRTINKLWTDHSNRHFGFSVQKQIYLSVNKNIGYFGERVGWRGKEGWFGGALGWHSYDFLTFKREAPRGHLPGCWLRIAPGLHGGSKIDKSLKGILERNDW